jgi:predicted  nucleic acid-binding Zn-ribbon protein
MFSLVKDMGLIADLLKDSPLKPEQLENIAQVEKRIQDEKLGVTRELERLKTEYERVRTELDQARGLVRVLEQEVAEWRRHLTAGLEDPASQPGAEAGS